MIDLIEKTLITDSAITAIHSTAPYSASPVYSEENWFLSHACPKRKRMASIRQRSGTWHARVRGKDYPDASFETKKEAQTWARSIESAMDQGVYQSIQPSKDMLLADVLQRYMDGVTPSKRGAQREAEGIQFMMRQKIASYSMANLTPAVIAGYRDDRLKIVSAGTIIRELSVFFVAVLAPILFVLSSPREKRQF